MLVILFTELCNVLSIQCLYTLRGICLYTHRCIWVNQIISLSALSPRYYNVGSSTWKRQLLDICTKLTISSFQSVGTSAPKVVTALMRQLMLARQARIPTTIT